MSVIYGLIPLMLILGLAMVIVFFWTVRSGQYDDLDGDSHRILMDDDDPRLPGKKKKAPKAGDGQKQQGFNWPDNDDED